MGNCRTAVGARLEAGWPWIVKDRERQTKGLRFPPVRTGVPRRVFDQNDKRKAVSGGNGSSRWLAG